MQDKSLTLTITNLQPEEAKLGDFLTYWTVVALYKCEHFQVWLCKSSFILIAMCFAHKALTYSLHSPEEIPKHKLNLSKNWLIKGLRITKTASLFCENHNYLYYYFISFIMVIWWVVVSVCCSEPKCRKVQISDWHYHASSKISE